jgi:hypothetical protein
MSHSPFFGVEFKDYECMLDLLPKDIVGIILDYQQRVSHGDFLNEIMYQGRVHQAFRMHRATHPPDEDDDNFDSLSTFLNSDDIEVTFLDCDHTVTQPILRWFDVEKQTSDFDSDICPQCKHENMGKIYQFVSYRDYNAAADDDSDDDNVEYCSKCGGIHNETEYYELRSGPKRRRFV